MKTTAATAANEIVQPTTSTDTGVGAQTSLSTSQGDLDGPRRHRVEAEQQANGPVESGAQQ